jgi:hypothetical protein
MEAANSLKHQNQMQRKETSTEAGKSGENLNSPSYDAELNAATASIISLPIETNSPLITTHADVSDKFFNLN